MKEEMNRSLIVAVATYQRPEQLRDCLNSLALLQSPAGVEVSYLVVDNDPSGSAASFVSGHSLEVTYLSERTPGIVAARNCALEYAEAHSFDYLAFLDDDETVGSEWLNELITCLDAFAADIVTGPSVPILQSGTNWIERAGFFPRRSLPHGTRMEVAATNNVLISKHLFSGPTKLRFNDVFSATGGEDTDFFTRAAMNGHSIIWCESAPAWDHVPPNRVTWGWVSRRAIRNGQVSAAMASRWHRHSRLRCFLSGVIRLLYGSARVVRALVTLKMPNANDLWPLLRGIGWILAASGAHVHEYRGNRGKLI